MDRGITKRVKAHCKHHGIRIEHEGEDARFIAPMGRVFGNDASQRLVEDVDYMTERELVWILEL